MRIQLVSRSRTTPAGADPSVAPVVQGAVVTENTAPADRPARPGACRPHRTAARPRSRRAESPSRPPRQRATQKPTLQNERSSAGAITAHTSRGTGCCGSPPTKPGSRTSSIPGRERLGLPAEHLAGRTARRHPRSWRLQHAHRPRARLVDDLRALALRAAPTGLGPRLTDRRSPPRGPPAARRTAPSRSGRRRRSPPPSPARRSQRTRTCSTPSARRAAARRSPPRRGRATRHEIITRARSVELPAEQLAVEPHGGLGVGDEDFNPAGTPGSYSLRSLITVLLPGSLVGKTNHRVLVSNCQVLDFRSVAGKRTMGIPAGSPARST